MTGSVPTRTIGATRKAELDSVIRGILDCPVSEEERRLLQHFEDTGRRNNAVAWAKHVAKVPFRLLTSDDRKCLEEVGALLADHLANVGRVSGGEAEDGHQRDLQGSDVGLAVEASFSVVAHRASKDDVSADDDTPETEGAAA
ncbi:hypothetical protein ATO13_22151 [Stappia sp. 22II-S9-Z10]|nr:hypothetical protein ATO13_22151 [Stappia sp. 22II-S9-Z10]